MRNRLTSHERLELGLFLGLVAVLGVILAAVIQVHRLPTISAAAPGAAVPVLKQAEGPRVAEEFAGATVDLGHAAVVLPELLPIAAEKMLAASKGTETKSYAGKEYRLVKTLHLRVTAYAPDARCCYPYDGKTTASGLPVTTNGGKLVAADTSIIPLHALVSVPGYNSDAGVPVLDRGGAIKGNRLDVLMPSFDAAKKWGSRMLDVKVYQQVK